MDLVPSWLSVKFGIGIVFVCCIVLVVISEVANNYRRAVEVNLPPAGPYFYRSAHSLI